MRDGHTVRLVRPAADDRFRLFRQSHRAALVAVSGREAGMEYELSRDKVTVGRGPGVDLTFDRPTMSRQHAVIEFADGTFRVRDLGSTNGIQVNGNRVEVADLKHGDEIEIGGQAFQLVIDERDDEPEVYEIHADV